MYKACFTLVLQWSDTALTAHVAGDAQAVLLLSGAVVILTLDSTHLQITY